MIDRYLFIVNPVAGKRDSSLTLVPKLIEFNKEYGINGKIELTTAPNDAYRIAKNHINMGGKLRIVSCGGDGTLNEVVNAAQGCSDVDICQVPCGSGNDFINSIGAKQDFLDLKSNILDGKSIPIDIIKLGDRVGVAICSVGLDADIAKNIPKYRRLKLFGGGSMAYNMSIIERLTKPLGQSLVITADGERFEGSFLLVSVANSKYYGGGFCAAPRAVIDDGILELCMVKETGLARVTKVISQYKKGEHFHGDTIAPQLRDLFEARRVKKVEIFAEKPFTVNIDGECFDVNNIDIEVIEKIVNFVIPAGINR